MAHGRWLGGLLEPHRRPGRARARRALGPAIRDGGDPVMSQFLNYEQEGHVVTLTMNDPQRRNPLTGNSAVPEFLATIDRIHADHSVRAVILTGAGSAFSSGGNVKDMGRYSEMAPMELRR